MLYLEDYLEMIEHLPGELRERFTEMREMDLSVQNRVDCLAHREKRFFNKCSSLNPEDKHREFESIRREYARIIEDSAEKLQCAEESCSLVDRFLRKLDVELHNFKMELEADNRGITEVLEKRSLEMDNAGGEVTLSKENRYPKKKDKKRSAATMSTSSSPPPSSPGTTVPSFDPLTTPSRVLPKSSDRRNSFLFGQDALDSSNVANSSGPSGSLSGPTTYPLQHMGAGGNAIAVAASQAIAATQQLVPGRRTSSLKASYEAINLGVQTHEFSIGRELAGAAQSALAATNISMTPELHNQDATASKKQKLSKRAKPVHRELVGNAEDLGLGEGDEDWNSDPSEPRYCVCNQVSYGDMVACDNEDCPYEWFHYPCVGITATPKGKWFCPTCLARRKGRK